MSPNDRTKAPWWRRAICDLFGHTRDFEFIPTDRGDIERAGDGLAICLRCNRASAGIHNGQFDLRLQRITQEPEGPCQFCNGPQQAPKEWHQMETFA